MFAPSLDGRILAVAAKDGRTLWQATAPAGINGCPSVAGDLLLVGAGAPRRSGSRPELIAYGL